MTDGHQTEHYMLGTTGAAYHRYVLFDATYGRATTLRLATLDLPPGLDVLEIGCGIGVTACEFADTIAKGGHVTGFDAAGDLVDLARAEAVKRGLDNTTFVHANAEEFDYPPDRFDLAHTRYVLSYIPDARSVVANAYRALKPGGLFFSEEVIQAYVTHGDTAWFLDMGHWFGELVRLGGGRKNYGIEDLPSDMLDAGFTDLQITAHWPFEDQAANREMLRLALTNEFRDNLISNGVATHAEIDAVMAELERPDPNYKIATSGVMQVVGRKPG
ncbi:MAG: class I SAM-dependent methyltransferase [Pseudomonadota bacterium]